MFPVCVLRVLVSGPGLRCSLRCRIRRLLWQILQVYTHCLYCTVLYTTRVHVCTVPLVPKRLVIHWLYVLQCVRPPVFAACAVLSCTRHHAVYSAALHAALTAVQDYTRPCGALGCVRGHGALCTPPRLYKWGAPVAHPGAWQGVLYSGNSCPAVLLFQPYRALFTVATEEVFQARHRGGNVLGPLLTIPVESMVRLAQHHSPCHGHQCVHASAHVCVPGSWQANMGGGASPPRAVCPAVRIRV